MELFDCIVVGGGRSGVEAARAAVGLGARTALIERAAPGGRHARGEAMAIALGAVAKTLRRARELPDSGLDRHDPSYRLHRVLEWVRSEVGGEPNAVVEGVTTIAAEARFQGPGVLAVHHRWLKARRAIVLAPGSAEVRSSIPGGEIAHGLERILEWTVLPESVVFLGASPAAVVCAQALARLGAKVTIVDEALGAGDLMSAAAHELDAILVRDGVTLRRDATVMSLRRSGRGVALTLRAAGNIESDLQAGEVIQSPVLAPDLGALALELGGVEVTARGIRVREGFRTSAKRVLAIGSAIGEPCLGSESRSQARFAVRGALVGTSPRFDPERLLRSTATDPAVACVGIGVRDAGDRGIEALSARVPYRDTSGHERGVVELVASRRGRVLGCLVVGPDAVHLATLVGLAIDRKLDIGELAAQSTEAGPEQASLVAAADAVSRSTKPAFFGRIRSWLRR